jgi:hypothetical protein
VTHHQQLDILGRATTGTKNDDTEDRPHARIRDRQHLPHHPAERAG